MHPTCCRLSSTSISSSTRKIADELRHQAQSRRPQVRRQLIDANQLQRLSLTLDRPNLYTHRAVTNQAEGPPDGTPVPPSYHLAYFTPAIVPDQLGPDGADVSFNPPAPFTRRMWAGGSIVWQRDNPLRVGDRAVETTKLLSSEAKQTRSGEEMIVVGVEKIFENDRGLSLTDRRDWIFRLRLDPETSTRHYPEPGASEACILPEPHDHNVLSRDFVQTPVSLFRFSACTFNAHMIHYSREWCRDMEGQPEIVVHGPLNLMNMADFWRDVQGDGGHAIPSSLRYRATAPFYAHQKYRALLEACKSDTYIRLWGSDGKGIARMGMMADIIH